MKSYTREETVDASADHSEGTNRTMGEHEVKNWHYIHKASFMNDPIDLSIFSQCFFFDPLDGNFLIENR